MQIWDNYYDAVAEANWWYAYCCWEVDDGTGYPPGFSVCYSEWQQALNAAEFSRNMQLDWAVINYEMQVSICMNAYNACTMGCPTSSLPRPFELADGRVDRAGLTPPYRGHRVSSTRLSLAVLIRGIHGGNSQ